MNNVSLVGRLVRDPEIRYTDGGSSITRITIAVDKRFKKEGEPQADFIPCIAFGKSAENIEKFFSKGNKIGVTGRIQTGSYTNKDGNKVYTTDVIVDTWEFVESASSSPGTKASDPITDSEDFMAIPDGIDDELPFN